HVLGRETELVKMLALMDLVRAGQRQTVFITGEAGIGKTTLVEAFLEHVATIPGALIVRGQCLEHFGASEAYLPVLDGFSRLASASMGTRVPDIMREQAPAGLAHMSLTNLTQETRDLQSPAGAPTRERMLREMAQAIERLAEQDPLLVVLEDLHWSDSSAL